MVYKLLHVRTFLADEERVRTFICWGKDRRPAGLTVGRAVTNADSSQSLQIYFGLGI